MSDDTRPTPPHSGSVGDFTWRVYRSGNPNKGWVIDSDRRKLSALMSYKAADALCVAHNMIVGYLNALKGQNHE